MKKKKVVLVIKNLETKYYFNIFLNQKYYEK